MRLGEAVRQYVRERRESAELNGNSARKIGDRLVRFARLVGDDLDVAAVTWAEIDTWWRARGRLAPNTRRTELGDVRSFYRWAIRRGYATADPTVGVRAPKVPRSVPRHLDHEPIEATLACADTRLRVILLLMWRLGLRCCEVAAIQIGDVDRDGLLTVHGKGGHERLLPLPGVVAEAIEEWMAEQPAAHGPLIRSYADPRRGIGAQHISNLVARAMTDAGVKRRARDGFSAHPLRHTLCADLLDRDADLRVVQEILGHAHLSTTALYAKRRVATGLMRAALDPPIEATG